MADIHFYAARPGDVCNRHGDIRGTEAIGTTKIVTHGMVNVTLAQARRAEEFGWSVVTDPDAAMVLIERADRSASPRESFIY